MADEIVPDDKDWTWVLQRPCPDCGFDPSSIDARSVGSLVRANAIGWNELLGSGRTDLRLRPDPATWSALEYGAHVRDVYRLFLERLRLMLEADDPLFANWDQDATALEDRYGEQDPAVVAGELSGAASTLADAFDAVADDEWGRTGRRSDGAAFTVESFAIYLIHDPVHHLWDVTGAP